MSEDEKDQRRFARIEREILAKQRAMRCEACGEAGKILWSGTQPPLTFPPPLWVVENDWLLEMNPLCADCIAAGARVELCFEGGTQHKFWTVENHVICQDCGGDCDDPGIDTASTKLIRMRLEGTMAAREAEIGYLVCRMATVTLDGPRVPGSRRD